MKTVDRPPQFADPAAVERLLQQWPHIQERKGREAPGLGALRGLLEAWEELDEEASQAAEALDANAPAIRSLLREVSAQIESHHWHTTGWNVFDILGRVRLEDAHSDTLAWLFKPWEAHGLGDEFLHEFAYRATGKRLPNGRVREVETRKSIGPTTGIIDIEVQGDGWVLAIENKVEACESRDEMGRYQTERYAEHYRCLGEPGETVFCVFLTRAGKNAEAGDFRPMSYRTLREMLDRMPCVSDAGQVVRWFSDHIRNDFEVTQ
jgi:Fe-S-cluster containining protein